MLVQLETDRKTDAEQALDWVRDAVYGFCEARIEDRWCCQWRLRHGIVMSEAAKVRTGQILGWIAGLAAGDEKLAQALALDFLRALDGLRDFGGCEDVELYDGRVDRVPNYMIDMHDDGTFGGYSLLFCRRVPDDYQGDVRVTKKGIYDTEYRYAVAFNGGLLYHGPGAGNTFAVTLGDRLWSVHT